MPTLNISRETYERLARTAAARNMTVERLVEPLLERLIADEQPTSEERRAALDDWMRIVQKRTGRYLTNYVADDSRESIYEGRGE